MKHLRLLALAALTVFLLLLMSSGADSQSAPFAITQEGCGGCQDFNLDWGDTNYMEAEGQLTRTFMWLSKWSGDIGLRHASLEFSGLGIATLYAYPNTQRIVGPGSVCLAYSGVKAAVIVRGYGQAWVRFLDGPGAGCTP